MATSALRARKLRQHSKRSPSLIGNFIDKAQDGHFGRIPQTIADNLESSNNGDHGEGNNGNGNGNGGGNGGGNNGNGNDNGNNGGGNGNGGGNSNNDGSNGNGGSNNNGGDKGNGGNNGNGGGNGNDSSGGKNEDSNSGSNNSPPAQGDGKGGNTSSGGSGNSHNGSNSGSSGSNRDGDSTKSASSDRDSQSTSGAANATHDPASSSTPSSGAKSDTSPTVHVGITIAAGDPSSRTLTFSAQPSVSTSSTDITSQGDSSHHSDRGAIAGGIVGALLFIFLIFGAWIVYKRRCKNRLPPSAEFINNPSSYPFARSGFGNAASHGEKNGAFGGNYGGAGTGAAGQANFGRLSTDSGEGISLEKRPQMGQYRDDSLPQPLPPHPPLPEVLYSTPARVVTPPVVPAPGSAPGTPTTPNGRRIPFGTGTFQFPPRPPQPHPQ